MGLRMDAKFNDYCPYKMIREKKTPEVGYRSQAGRHTPIISVL